MCVIGVCVGVFVFVWVSISVFVCVVVCVALCAICVYVYTLFFCFHRLHPPSSNTCLSSPPLQAQDGLHFLNILLQLVRQMVECGLLCEPQDISIIERVGGVLWWG